MDNLLAVFIALFLSFFTPAPESYLNEEVVGLATTTATVVKVIDGDTIKVLQEGEELTVRYIGIDTPEPYRDKEPACFSKEASARNVALVAGKTVELVADSELRDRYSRELRYVYVDGLFVNEVLVTEGYAKTLTIEPNVRFAEHFSELEQVAKKQLVGLWGDECSR